MLASNGTFTNILLVCPCDPTTLELAAVLAARGSGAVTCLQVVPELPRVWESLETVGGPIDMTALYLAEHQRRLEESYVAALQERGVQATAKALAGSGSMEAIREVVRHGHDLVLMTAEGSTRPDKRLFGSLSMQLVRKCPCPVWLAKPGQPAQSLRLLAAVDPDPAEPDRLSLNDGILELAEAFTADAGAELHVIHVWRLTGEKAFRGSGRFAGDQIQSLLNREQDRHRRAVYALVESHGLTGARVHMIAGDDAAAEIAATAARIDADVVVLGAVCRTGISGFLIGSTAEKALGELNCSVLAIKPEGFQTPVTLER